MCCFCRLLRTRNVQEEKEEDDKISAVTKDKQPPVKCRECRQLLDDPDLKLFPGDPIDAVRV